MAELNEDCGCGAASYETTEQPVQYHKTPDPMVGKRVQLHDGRNGLVDDSIRNSRGEVIGYVIEGDKGNFRVFRDKVMGILDESGVMATPANVVGMGDVAPPTRTSTGSGDQFPTLTVGTPAAKTKKKKTEEKPEKRKSSVMSFKDFMGSAKKSQE